MEVDPEITDENIERDLRFRRDEQIVCVIIRVIEIKRVADAEIQSQRVELRHRPDHVERQVRCNNDVILWLNTDHSWSKRAEHDRAAIIGIIDVVVVLDANGRTNAHSNGAQQQIVRDPRNILLSGIRRLLPRQGRAYCVLRIQTRAREQR